MIEVWQGPKNDVRTFKFISMLFGFISMLASPKTSILTSVFIIAFTCNAKRFAIPYEKKKSRHKTSSVKKIAGKKFRHWQNDSSLFTDQFFYLAI